MTNQKQNVIIALCTVSFPVNNLPLCLRNNVKIVKLIECISVNQQLNVIIILSNYITSCDSLKVLTILGMNRNFGNCTIQTFPTTAVK